MPVNTSFGLVGRNPLPQAFFLRPRCLRAPYSYALLL